VEGLYRQQPEGSAQSQTTNEESGGKEGGPVRADHEKRSTKKNPKKPEKPGGAECGEATGNERTLKCFSFEGNLKKGGESLGESMGSASSSGKFVGGEDLLISGLRKDVKERKKDQISVTTCGLKW